MQSPENGHCYLADVRNLSFAQARDACAARWGHLVTLSTEAENDFVGELHDAEHWIGATDDREDRAAGPGTYHWTNDEPWVYANWASGQPNAVATDCPNESGGAHCYEHCAYQKGSDAWIDRACWHTIAAVCEWDIEGGEGGAAGAGGAPNDGGASSDGAGAGGASSDGAGAGGAPSDGGAAQ